MCEKAIVLREQLMHGATNSLRTSPNCIGSEANHRRAITLQATPTGPETRLKDRTAELEAQITERLSIEERLRELTTRVLQAQDDEGRRIARELHDSVGQYLAAIQMNLSALEGETLGSLNASQSKRVADCTEMVNRCTGEIRTISYLLHPPLLDEMGLGCALAMYSEGFAQRSGIRVELDIPSDFGRLTTDTETAMFRIVQQSLANIYRHSGSPVAKIAIRQDVKEATMKICDEGHGISSEVLKEFDSGAHLIGVGIAGMRERTRALKGGFYISSDRNGTTIEVRFPIAQSLLPQQWAP
jgi:two-component system NarL family sensor kinase